MAAVSEPVDPSDDTCPGPVAHSIEHASAHQEEIVLQENNSSKIESQQNPVQNSEIEPESDSSIKEKHSEEDEEHEEEGECGFCLFMKSGPCRDSFIKWELCVEEAEKAKEDIVEKCHQVTALLKECMESNVDYYDPVLKAEKGMSDAALEVAATPQEEDARNESEVPRESETRSSSEENPENLEASDYDSSSVEPTELKSLEKFPRTSQQD